MGKRKSFGQKAEAKVLQCLKDIPKIEVSRPERDTEANRIDAFVRADGRELIVEIKATSKSGSAEIEGRLASAILTGEKYVSDDNKFLPIVFAPRIGPNVLDKLDAFMSEYRPQLAWGAVDEQGIRFLKIPSLSLELQGASVKSTEPKNRDTTTTANTFTDVNRLILKHLIYERGPEKYKDNLHKGESKNPAELARKLNHVSKPKVYQAVNTFKERGLLDSDKSGFFFPDVRELLKRWLAVEREVPTKRFCVRSIFGESFDDLINKATAQGIGYGISGFAACEFYEKRHTDFSLPEIYIFDSLESVVGKLDLEIVEEHAADMCLRNPKYSRSIREELRLDTSNQRYVDLWQAALDVSDNPRRGFEQAEFIAEEVGRWFTNDGE
jgi:hypothetical protein